MDFDMDLEPRLQQKKAGAPGAAAAAAGRDAGRGRRGGSGRRAVVTMVLSAVMFGSGYVAGGYGFSVANLRSMFGAKVATANTAAPAPAEAPAAQSAETAPTTAVTVAPAAKEPRASVAMPAVVEHAARAARKAPTAAAPNPAQPAVPNAAAVAAKNAAANARPATAAKPPAARFQPSTAKLSVLTSTLQHTRSQLELYNLQHRDQYPTLAQLQKDWGVLAKPTDVAGRVMMAAGRSTLGPYVKQPPVNPITNSAKVAAPGKASADTGWTYDEQTGLLKAVLPGYVIAPELDLDSVERVGG